MNKYRQRYFDANDLWDDFVKEREIEYGPEIHDDQDLLEREFNIYIEELIADGTVGVKREYGYELLYWN